MMNTKKVHIPVLLNEVLDYLKINTSGIYVDCTLGDGGYSKAIFDLLKTGTLVSIDCDAESIEFVNNFYKQDLERKDKKWIIVRSNFNDIDDVVSSLNINKVDGIVFDLGLSSRQLANSRRGFSFKSEGDLDMRMDERFSVKAVDLIKLLSEKELESIFSMYGEELFSGRIARELKYYVKMNIDKNISTETLVDIVCRAIPAKYRHGPRHPATRVFQALRIAVNDELHNLEEGLVSALSILDTNGRSVVVSYHSLEDRIVKKIYKQYESENKIRILTKKPLKATQSEILNNHRSRSAKLRAAEKL
ncbi:16S rRNA (cytosine(1402)-N(4))-methyltransferase RsmH [Candidatus Dojkabacteria bacterium]|nr:16S rRNA (cytosine(1402)-N(4))-methyltransferase RsmH [Candidatus Dojkabacteria bacterium]